MTPSDSTPSPSEELLARLLTDLDRAPEADRSAVVDRYLGDHPEHRDEIREVVAANAGVRAPAAAADPAAPRLRAGCRLGPFRVVRFVAHGGMGEVYEAVQDVLDRRVALKVIRSGFVSPTARARFLREQQVLAKLHQTNIVPVHHAGEEGDLQYCAMQYVDGASLHRVVTELLNRETTAGGGRVTPPIREVVGSLMQTAGDPSRPAVVTLPQAQPPAIWPDAGPPSSAPRTLSASYFDSVAAVMIQVAAAVQHGHDRHVCHRDLKPSNLIIDAAETCWVIDYGLACAVNGAAAPTGAAGSADGRLTVAPVGTPRYMAPEQFDGKADARTDVWGLGATLYELLTLRPAFRAEGWDATRDLVARAEPADPRALVRNVPADLSAICRKALAKDPAARYPTARAFADDMRRWREWKPTTVRPDWWNLRPVRLWAWRHKAWAATVVGVILGIAAGLAGKLAAAEARTAYANEQAERAKDRAEQDAERAKHATKQAEDATALAKERQQRVDDLLKQQARERAILNAQHRYLGERYIGWSREAVKQLEVANDIRRGGALRDHAAATLVGLDIAPILELPARIPIRPGHQGFGPVVFSPDGVQVLAGGWADGPRMAPSPAIVWDGNNASKPVASTRAGVGPVAFPDAASPLQLIVPAEVEGRSLTLWNVVTNTAVVEIPLPALGLTPAAALSPDAKWAAASFVAKPEAGKKPPSPVTLLWAIDRTAGKVAVKKRGEWPGGPTALTFSPDGALLAGGSAGEIVVRSTGDGTEVLRLTEGEMETSALAFGRNFRRPSGERPKLAGMADGWLLAVGSQGGSLSVWDLRTRTRISSYYGSEHNVYAAAFSPDGSLLTSAGRTYPFVWDVATGRPLLRVAPQGGGQGSYTIGAAFSPDGRRLAFGSPTVFGDGSLHVFQLENGRGIHSYYGLTGVVEKVWLSPSGTYVAGLAQNWQLGVWERATGHVKFVWDVPPGFATDSSAVAFDDNEAVILCACGERVSRWSLTSGERTTVWKVPEGFDDCLVIRPGKKPLLVRRDSRPKRNSPIRARELGANGTMAELFTMTDIERFNRLALSADGRIVVVNAVIESKLDGSPVDKNRTLLFDISTNKPTPRQVENVSLDLLGRLSAGGDMLVLEELNGAGNVARGHIVRLADRKKIATHPSRLVQVDTAGKRGLTSGHPSDQGVALYRVGEEHPIVTFDLGRPAPSGYAYALSPNGQFVYWGRRDGTVCVADVNRCLQQLIPFSEN